MGVLQNTSGLETRRKKGVREEVREKGDERSLLQQQCRSEVLARIDGEAQATERLRRRRTLEHATEVRRRAGRRGRFVSRLLHSCLHSRDIPATDSSSVFGR